MLAARAAVPEALTAGFGRPLLAGSIALLAAAILALRIANTRTDTRAEPPEPPEPAAATPTSQQTVS
jgi:hypothetical protein